MPPDSVATLRWLGTTDFELAYRDQVILLDTYYNRGPRFRPIGFTVDQVKRADAILIGHGHWDHMADVAPVAKQTGAKVFGAPVTIEAALKLGVPAPQTEVVRGGEVLKFKGLTVETILAQHSTLSLEVLKSFGASIALVAGALTPEEKAAEEAIRARGTSDPRVIKEGTIAYLFTFDGGFRLIYRNSAGPITDAERAVMQRIGSKTDVAIVAYIGHSSWPKSRLTSRCPSSSSTTRGSTCPGTTTRFRACPSIWEPSRCSWRSGTRCPGRAATRSCTASRCA